MSKSNKKIRLYFWTSGCLSACLTIGGYSKFGLNLQIYYNLIIAMLFDVALSLCNFNKLTKKRILSQFSKIENWHDSKNVLLNIIIIFFFLKKYSEKIFSYNQNILKKYFHITKIIVKSGLRRHQTT